MTKALLRSSQGESRLQGWGRGWGDFGCMGEGGGKGGAKAKGVTKEKGKNMECIALWSRYVTKCELCNTKDKSANVKAKPGSAGKRGETAEGSDKTVLEMMTQMMS